MCARYEADSFHHVSCVRRSASTSAQLTFSAQCRDCLPEVVAGRVNLIGVCVLGQVSALLLAKEVRRVLAGFFAGVRKAVEDTFFVQTAFFR